MLIHTEARELKFSWLKTNIRDILLFHGCSFRQILQIFCLRMQYFSRFLALFFFAVVCCVACEAQTHFRSSFLSLRPEMRLRFAGYLLWNNQIKFILLLFKAEHLLPFSPETGPLLISSLLEPFRWRRSSGAKRERRTPSLSLLNTSLYLNAWNKPIDF